MSSFITHRDAMRAILTERSNTYNHHKNYLQDRITKLRELKLRKELGQVAVPRAGDNGIHDSMEKAIDQEARSIKYAIDCVRRSRRELWKVYALQGKQRVREMPHD